MKISSHRFPIEEAPVGVDDGTQRTDFSCLGNADFVIRNIDLHKLDLSSRYILLIVHLLDCDEGQNCAV